MDNALIASDINIGESFAVDLTKYKRIFVVFSFGVAAYLTEGSITLDQVLQNDGYCFGFYASSVAWATARLLAASVSDASITFSLSGWYGASFSEVRVRYVYGEKK